LRFDLNTCKVLDDVTSMLHVLLRLQLLEKLGRQSYKAVLPTFWRQLKNFYFTHY